MNLGKLKLENFRCYEKREVELSDGVTWVLGPNAIGKTNILEALRLISTGDSFRAKTIDETVRFGEEFGRIEAEIEDELGEKMSLAVLLTKGELQGKRVAKRRFFIDGVAKRKMDFLGIIPSVVFRPEDLQLMEGSPSLRRDWLNDVLSQTDKEYVRSLQTYTQAMRRRNKILEAIREGIANKYQLTFWDGLVIRHGQRLEEGRQKLVEYINSIWQKSDLFNTLQLNYDPSVISEKRLEQYQREEVASAHTLVGPHKDDWGITTNEHKLPINTNGQLRDIGKYGSRGEQRMAILGLKMGELLYLEEKLDKRPLLLLDDIFSELDEKHINEVYRVMLNRQVVVTTTDKGDIGDIKQAKTLELK